MDDCFAYNAAMHERSAFLPKLPAWAWALVLALLLLPLIYWRFCPDDFYIYLQYSRNLLQNGQLAFNPGERSYGFTSPLWLAVLGLCGLTPFPVFFIKMICWLLFALTLWRFHGLLSRDFSGSPPAFIGVALLGANPWVLRWALSGMETAAVLFAAVLAFEWFLDERPGAWLVVGLLPLLRPELLIWVLAYSAFSLVRGRLRQALAVWAPALAWHGFCFWYFGQVFPNTAYAKSLGFSLTAALSAAQKIVASMPPLESLALAITAILLVRRRPGEGRSWPAMAAVALLMALFVGRGVNVHTRYLVPIFPFTIYLLLLLLEKKNRLLPYVFILALGIGLLQGIFWIYPATRNYIRSEKQVNIVIGRYLNRVMKPDETVFLWDIGAIGYYARRHVVDLNGIIDRKVSNRREGFRSIIRGYLQRSPQRAFFVDIHFDRDNFERRPAAGVRQRLLFSLPFHNMFIMQGRPLFYSVYELIPADGPAPGPS
jgi:hypothetical protein